MTLRTIRVWEDITRAAKDSATTARVAVAYFGAKGDLVLPLRKGSSLVVDATIPTIATGSTCPAALKRLQRGGVEIYSAQYLHAKVYVFDAVAFVGSPNASARSRDTLIETVVRIGAKAAILSARNFVESMCITRLTGADLDELNEYYRPPVYGNSRRRRLILEQARFSTLLMELTLEQGHARGTQVQPPKAVWEYYFGFRVGHDRPPMLTLVDESRSPAIETRRRVVGHHHNYTIEVPGAGPPLPAILEIRRVDEATYRYNVHRREDPRFAGLDRQLRETPNPLRDTGRLWIVV